MWFMLVWNQAILCKNHIVLLFIFFIALMSAPMIKIKSNPSQSKVCSIREDRQRMSRKILSKSEVIHNPQVNEHLWFQQKYSYYITAWQFIVIAKAAEAMKSKAVYLQSS